MKKQHTPGPWAIREHWSDDGAFEVYPTRGGAPRYGQWSALAEVPEYGPEDAPEAEANARLIAAAPELLEALKAMLSEVEGCGCSTEKQARAAIAKAEGDEFTSSTELRRLQAENEQLHKDAKRYQWLRKRMLGVSFDWNESGITALSFEMPDGCEYGGDCDQNIDAAIAKLTESGS